jgi:hypothetical protein
VASSYHGAPRTIGDLDVVIDPTPATLARLVRAFHGAGLEADDAATLQALAERRSFEARDPTTGWRIDLIVRRDRPFSHEEFARRQAVDLPGTTACIATAEDTILAKLERARAAEAAEQQLRDVRAILAVSGDALDYDYLDGWAAQLGLTTDWDAVRQG